MLSFFLNKQSSNNNNRQETPKRSLDQVVQNDQTQILESKEMNKIEGGNTNQNNRAFPPLDDFFSGPIPQ